MPLLSLRERINAFLHSRYLAPYILLLAGLALLIGHVFNLQIVHGNEYLNHFTLSIEKDIRIPGSRGNIYDRNGVLLAYNELAYSVTITDTIESGSKKNETLNNIIMNMIRIIEDNGDSVISDFGVYTDESGEFCFSWSGTQHQRFLADIFGKSSINDLSYTERSSNPAEVMAYLAGEKKFGIGSYSYNGKKRAFFPMMGYTNEEILKIAIIRYQLSLNSFQKYIATTVATDVSERTVAVIMENSSTLQGVAIAEDTVRRYNHAVYFSQIIGYTGRISQSEYEAMSLENPGYATTDYVGKTGIELAMESQLQGKKGSETVYVDNMGKVIERRNITLPVAGNDIYLTIDADLQIAAYHLVEQKVAGILVNKLRDEKTIDQSGRNRLIPVYDVYSALYGNSVIDLNHMSKSYAGDTERQVYDDFRTKQGEVFTAIKKEMLYGETPYSELDSEMKEYESFIISMLGNSDHGLIKGSEVDTADPTYLAWRTEETISIKEYLLYCISKQWLDLSKLSLSGQYSDSEEVYDAVVEYTIDQLRNNNDFAKRLYKYMLLEDRITGRETCLILWEQDVIQVDADKIDALKRGNITAYRFISDLLLELKITPAQLGLDPCSGSVVMTDPNTGEVLALVSYPGYDNNRLANRADSAYLAKLSADKSNPLWNYATQQRTAPGSTFKMVSSVAGVSEGVIDIYTPITCEGSFTKLAGSVHNCWIYPGNHGELDLTGGIENSCNYFFYEVGYRLANDGTGYNDHTGIEKLKNYAELFGLGEKSGVEIAESEPRISDQYPVVSAIGQGTHNYTTAGLARYVSAVANGGTVYDLTLIHEIRNGSGNTEYYFVPKVKNTIDLDPTLWHSIHTGMELVVANKSYFNIEGMSAAGKTGTAQEQTNRPNHALFVGYAPAKDPRIAIAVRIANGYSSDFAAQVACDCFQYYFAPEIAESLITGTASDATAVSGGD
ncbi:MAG: penicillin-binding protein [Lachnospiraceae bacterium]|nr:penicillin-binding protein [Lachnospiraceae bacterium]